MKKMMFIILLLFLFLPFSAMAATEVDIIDADMLQVTSGLSNIEADLEALDTSVFAISTNVQSLEANLQTIVDNQDQVQWMSYILTGLLVAWSFIAGIRVVNS